jgi:hypothetical protein
VRVGVSLAVLAECGGARASLSSLAYTAPQSSWRCAVCWHVLIRAEHGGSAPAGGAIAQLLRCWGGCGPATRVQRRGLPGHRLDVGVKRHDWTGTRQSMRLGYHSIRVRRATQQVGRRHVGKAMTCPTMRHWRQVSACGTRVIYGERRDEALSHGEGSGCLNARSWIARGMGPASARLSEVWWLAAVVSL